MNKPFALLLLPALATCAMLSPASAAPARQHLLLDADWRFQQLAPTTLRNAAPITAWRWRPGQPDDGGGHDGGDTGHDRRRLAGSCGQAGRLSGQKWLCLVPNHSAALTAQARILHFEGVDDNATVYLNGQKLTHHEGWNDPFDVPLDTAWNAAGPNVVVVLVENTAGGGGITAPVMLGVSAAPGSSDPSNRR